MGAVREGDRLDDLRRLDLDLERGAVDRGELGGGVLEIDEAEGVDAQLATFPVGEEGLPARLDGECAERGAQDVAIGGRIGGHAALFHRPEQGPKQSVARGGGLALDPFVEPP